MALGLRFVIGLLLNQVTVHAFLQKLGLGCFKKTRSLRIHAKSRKMNKSKPSLIPNDDTREMYSEERREKLGNKPGGEYDL